MSPSRPIVALITPRQPDRFLQLAAAIRRWCDVVALGQEEGGRASAVIATSPGVEVPDELAVAVWVQHEEELSDPMVTERALAVLATRAELLHGLGGRGVLVPTGDRVPGTAYLSPFVRQRLRRARGLSSAPVLEQHGDTWSWPGRHEPVSGSLVPTALACAAAVCVESAQALVAALAFGTPAVSDEATTGAVGAIGGQQVLTAETPMERRRLAEDLASDVTTASRLSWAGRRHYEQRYDISRTAILLIGRLLRPAGSSAGALPNVELRLGELNTPTTAVVRSRLATATPGLPGLD